MTGGPRYWNEDSQRWEEADADGAAAGPGGATGGGADAPTGPGGWPTPTVVSAHDPGPAAPPDGVGPPAPDGGGPAGAGTGPDVPAAPGVSPSAPTLTGLQWPGAAPPPPPPPGTTPPPPAPWPPAEPYYGPAHQPGAPVPGPATAPGARRRRLWLVVGGAAALGVTVGLVATLIVRNGGGTDDRADDRPTVTASPSPTAEPTATGTVEQPPPGPTGGESIPEPSTLVDDLPAGYELFTDGEGFTIARPAGWSRDDVDSKYGIDVVNYYSADRTHRLQVFEVSEASPAESHGLFLSDAVQKAPGFTELSLEDLGGAGVPGSRLEYLVDTLKGQPDVGGWHVVDERFEAADGKLYAVAAYTPDAEGREAGRELLRTALSGFCPPATTCGTGGG